VVGLRLRDVTFSAPYVDLHIRGKGRRERLLSLWKAVADSVRAWLAVRGEAPVPGSFSALPPKWWSAGAEVRRDPSARAVVVRGGVSGPGARRFREAVEGVGGGPHVGLRLASPALGSHLRREQQAASRAPKLSWAGIPRGVWGGAPASAEPLGASLVTLADRPTLLGVRNRPRERAPAAATAQMPAASSSRCPGSPAWIPEARGRCPGGRVGGCHTWLYGFYPRIRLRSPR
jgi:hypothetical protein